MKTRTKPKLFGRRYDWPALLAVVPREFIKGRDFNGRADTFATQLRAAAVRLGLERPITASASEDGRHVHLTWRENTAG